MSFRARSVYGLFRSRLAKLHTTAAQGNRRAMGERVLHCLQSVAAIVLAVLLPAQAASPTEPGYYTASQADAGRSLYKQACAKCHGDALQGGVGPALAGREFLGSLQMQHITGDYFYHFMSSHMPLSNPGSLTEAQYLDLMAFVLQANGYASGPNPLGADARTLNRITLAPQP